MPGYLRTTRPGTVNTVLEIDPQLLDIGREQLGLSAHVDVRVADARISIRQVEDRSIDVVIGDAYSGMSVPWHLTTREFNEEISRVMRPDGIYTMNVIDWSDLLFVRAEARTLLEVFEHVVLLAPDTYLAGEAGGNFVFVASSSPIDLKSLQMAVEARGGSERGVTRDELGLFIGDGILLTDDYAPVDQILGRP